MDAGEYCKILIMKITRICFGLWHKSTALNKPDFIMTAYVSLKAISNSKITHLFLDLNYIFSTQMFIILLQWKYFISFYDMTLLFYYYASINLFFCCCWILEFLSLIKIWTSNFQISPISFPKSSLTSLFKK